MVSLMAASHVCDLTCLMYVGLDSTPQQCLQSFNNIFVNMLPIGSMRERHFMDSNEENNVSIWTATQIEMADAKMHSHHTTRVEPRLRDKLLTAQLNLNVVIETRTKQTGKYQQRRNSADQH